MPSLHFIDTHAHLTFAELLRQSDAVLQRAEDAEVRQIITIGTDELSNRQAVELAGQYEQVFAAVGYHPEDVPVVSDDLADQLASVARYPSVVAIGECGLDYARGPRDHGAQKIVLARQLEIAGDLNLPLIIHTRDAWTDITPLLSEVTRPQPGVLHCFSGDLQQAEWFLARGWYLGFNGIVTFKNARDLQEIARQVPLERILLETDCPFLAPQPVRGQLNEPSYIPMIAATLAELKNIPIDEIATQTTQNARTLFNI